MYVKQNTDCEKYWINDANEDLMAFWLYAQKDSLGLANRIQEIKDASSNYKKLFKKYKHKKTSTEYEKAVRFFILNRLTFSGAVDSGGYSSEERFTDSAIKRIEPLREILFSVSISDFDYRSVLRYPGDDVFMFLDPPYHSAAKSKLYGRRGELHKNFSFEEFALEAKCCKHKWLLTYSDTPEVREAFHFANIRTFNITYGMGNKGGSPERAKEIFITNY